VLRDGHGCEVHGELRASESRWLCQQQAVVEVYVKLADGSVKFHKDGYTGLRGPFGDLCHGNRIRFGPERGNVLTVNQMREFSRSACLVKLSEWEVPFLR
jgi:hypothetical protein